MEKSLSLWTLATVKYSKINMGLFPLFINTPINELVS